MLVIERYPQSLWKYLESNNFGLKERLEIAIKLTKELKIVRDGNVVHRDLKPTNIMVDAKNELALVDFGIGNYDTGLTGSSGAVLGRKTIWACGHFQSWEKSNFNSIRMEDWLASTMVIKRMDPLTNSGAQMDPFM